MADSTLSAIRTKVRRLTRSLDSNNPTDNDINEYINTFIQYDFPENLRLFSLRKTLTFYTEPNIDTYASNAIANDPLNNFKNVYTSVHDPVYVAGYQIKLSQSREEFYGWYPFTNNITQIATGDGISLAFNGTLSNIPVLRNNVSFVSKDANNIGIRVSDNGSGLLLQPTGALGGTIDYETGDYTINFLLAPDANEPIYAETYSYVASRPQYILFYNNEFTLRPVPDKVYPVQLEAYVRPTELLQNGDIPELEQWWQYIAYGAAKKIFEDRDDIESVARITPEFEEQESKVLRRTIMQLSNERVSTIYTQQTNAPGFSFWNTNLF